MKFTQFLIAGLMCMIWGQNATLAQCSKKNTHTVIRTSWQDHQARRSEPRGQKDIVELAASSHDLSTLVAAVKAAGLVETLRGKGPFTVFAPTNQAFEALPDGTLEALLKPENKDQLIAILTYHVVPGRIEANDLSSGKVASVEGSNIEVAIGENSVKINDALVIGANKRAINGVVHIIDRVILPPQ